MIASRARRLRVTAGAVLACLGVALGPLPAAADTPPEPEPYRFETLDALLLLGGAAATGVGKFLLDPQTRDVPPQGLDPADISWEWDRNALKVPDPDALTGSNLFLVGGGLAPSAFYLAQGPDEASWDVAGRLWTTQAEAFLVTTGVVQILKVVSSRPRPYTYLPEDQRPEGVEYDVTEDRAFESSPSGHAASTWSLALSGAAHLAYARPDWSGSAHFANGALAGGLATAAGVLRVESGQHFPSDVLAGSALGGVIGLGTAMLQRGPDPGTGSRAASVRNCLLGALAGATIALLLTPPASPFLD